MSPIEHFENPDHPPPGRSGRHARSLRLTGASAIGEIDVSSRTLARIDLEKLD